MDAKSWNEDKLRQWLMLRAIEWSKWPLFVTQPIIPIIFIFFPILPVLIALFVADVLWRFVRCKLVSPALANSSAIFVGYTKWPSSICATIYLLYAGQYVVALLALTWPVVAGFISWPVTILTGRPLPIGFLEQAFLLRIIGSADAKFLQSIAAHNESCDAPNISDSKSRPRLHHRQESSSLLHEGSAVPLDEHSRLPLQHGKSKSQDRLPGKSNEDSESKLTVGVYSPASEYLQEQPQMREQLGLNFNTPNDTLDNESIPNSVVPFACAVFDSIVAVRDFHLLVSSLEPSEYAMNPINQEEALIYLMFPYHLMGPYFVERSSEWRDALVIATATRCSASSPKFVAERVREYTQELFDPSLRNGSSNVVAKDGPCRLARCAMRNMLGRDDLDIALHSRMLAMFVANVTTWKGGSNLRRLFDMNSQLDYDGWCELFREAYAEL